MNKPPDHPSLATNLLIADIGRYPIRRLIVTGEDNPDNLTTVLGPVREPVGSKLVKETRIDVLLCPPPGSPNHAVSEHLDAGSPRWTPRPPNAEEEAELGKVKDMKLKVVKQLGDRKDLNKIDLRELILSMGDNWVEGLLALEAVTNSADQDVRM